MKNIVKLALGLALGILILLSGCRGHMQGQLEQIDSLLGQGNVDAAYMYLQTIPQASLDNREDIAYYTLLKTEALYRLNLPIKNDSIDYSIFYYEQGRSRERLARAYYYKGVTLCFNRGNMKNGIMMLKKAEDTAKGLSDLALLHKIYQSICYVNLVNKNYATALVYAKWARELGYKTGNKRWIAYSLTYTANAYFGLADLDSNLNYLLESLKYYHYLSADNQALLLANISDSYRLKKDFTKAETYIRRALKERPSDYTYAILGNIYMQRGDFAKAHDYLLKASASTDELTREKALFNLFRLKQKMGDYKGSAELADSLIVLKNQQEVKWQQNNIYEIQNRFDREERERALRSYRFYAVAILVIFLLSMASFIFYHKYKMARARRNLLEKHLLVSEYSGRIDEMQLSQSEANKELSTLRQRLNVMKDKEVRVLSNGKLLYESIKNGGNTIHWSSMDFLDFLEYFKLIDMDYINRLDSLYSNLSPKQHLFLIARHLGKNEDEVGAILGIGASSVRSLKSRIKSKRIKG
ncbi:MAG: hypothetical protein MR450_00110 [Prevotella sp.]|nr:hypothetical protein [Prevotella sp.]MDY4038825.1 hypothetical protein [Prevotella sp.]